MNIKQAFTLIELLVVIAIIGILSGLIVVSMNGVTQKATIAKAQVFSNSLKNSLMMNLVSEWKLDGNVIDSWGSSAEGSLNGSPAIDTNCVYDSCYSFDGVDDYAQISSASLAGITNEFTVTAWFKRKGYSGGTLASSYHGIIRGINGDGWNPRILVFSAGNGIYLQYRSTDFTQHEYSGTSNVNFDLNKWHFLVVTKGSFGVKMYFDDKVAGENPTFTHAMAANTGGEILIGCGASPIVHYMANGSIDEVRVFKEAIHYSQIREMYYLGLNSLFMNSEITKEEYLSRINNLGYEH